MTDRFKIIKRVQTFLVGGGFPALALSLLVCWEALLVGILLMPASPTALGAFAENFRVWCFGYDPATGQTEWSYVMAMLMPQLMIGALILVFWWEPLRDILRHPRAAFTYGGTAALMIAGSAAGFVLSSAEAPAGDLPFPAEELRTAYEAPPLSLVNQEGEPVELSELRGKVVVLTAIYASCGHTCPAILQQTKAAVSALGEQRSEDLRIIAVTLDAAHDSSDVLAQLAERHGMRTPLYNLVTGPVADVEATLDRMQVARERDPETGVINHANLFLLIDRDGKLAYRFGLGELQQRWLTTALGVLLDETGTAG